MAPDAHGGVLCQPPSLLSKELSEEQEREADRWISPGPPGPGHCSGPIVKRRKAGGRSFQYELVLLGPAPATMLLEVGRLLLSAGQPGAVQADGRTVRGLVVRAAIVRGRPTRRVRGLVPSTVGLAAHVKRAAPGLVVRTGDAGAPVGVRVGGERRAGHVEAGSVRTRFRQEVPGVELQTACHQVGSGLGQAFTQHLHVGDHIWPFPVA
ncbi:hypothetical protein EYF80_035329 [Liparis tanakae]|uniref:Uncharacterized protein n=1 Tax=Liparis tanakae TaxID=230148 RepID=A0A4Z2GMN6_9TELE|nr:hypothetical protein EYF80_035329 [Liparis tanakae]